MSDPEDLNTHYGAVVRDLVENRVVPLLGAGVNLCDRLPGAAWSRGDDLPSGGELADYLADRLLLPEGLETSTCCASRSTSLSREGTGPLYAELRKLFDADYEPTRVHDFFASLPKRLAARRESGTPQLPAHRHDELRRRARASL